MATTQPVEPSLAVTATAETEPLPPLSIAPAAVRASPSQRASHSWIESGVGAMVMPLTFAIVAMIAPVLWIFNSRARR